MASLMDRLRRYQPDEELDFHSLPDDLSRLGAGVDPSKIGRMPQKVKSGALLPLSRYDDGSVSFDPSAGILGSAADALSAPYRAVTGDLEDPESEALNMAGWLMGGGFGRAVAKPASAELGMFGGRLAKTADLDALAKAEAADAAGTPREAIWDQTGWFKGKDGKWRFEIDDSDIAPKDNAPFRGGPLFFENGPTHINPESTTAAKVLGQDSNVVQAYPDLNEVDYLAQYARYGYPEESFSSFGRFGSNGEPKIRLQVPTYASGNDKAIIGTALHEVQHYIQDAEGFGLGGMPSKSDKAVLAAWQDDAKRWWEHKNKSENEIDDIRNDYRLKQKENYAHNDKVMEEAGARGELGLWDPIHDLSSHPYEKAKKIRKDYGIDYDDYKFPKNYEPAYKRLSGEVEARAVQKRANLSAAERRARYPWLDYDVPEADQIVRFGNDGR